MLWQQLEVEQDDIDGAYIVLEVDDELEGIYKKKNIISQKIVIVLLYELDELNEYLELIDEIVVSEVIQLWLDEVEVIDEIDEAEVDEFFIDVLLILIDIIDDVLYLVEKYDDILEAQLHMHLVHYVEFEDDDDELEVDDMVICLSELTKIIQFYVVDDIDDYEYQITLLELVVVMLDEVDEDDIIHTDNLDVADDEIDELVDDELDVMLQHTEVEEDDEGDQQAEVLVEVMVVKVQQQLDTLQTEAMVSIQQQEVILVELVLLVELNTAYTSSLQTEHSA